MGQAPFALLKSYFILRGYGDGVGSGSAMSLCRDSGQADDGSLGHFKESSQDVP